MLDQSGMITLGKELLQTGQLEDARDVFMRVRDQDRYAVEAYHLLGATFAKMGQTEAATACFKTHQLLEKSKLLGPLATTNTAPTQQLSFVPDVTGLLDNRPPISPEQHEKNLKNFRANIQVDLTSNCSHGCQYCVASIKNTDRNGSALDDMEAEQFLAHILALAGGRTLHYSMTGRGEVAEHKKFKTVAAGVLSAGHQLKIGTHGLTSAIIYDTFSGFDREAIKRLSFHLSFHLGAYLEDASSNRLDAYIDKHFDRIASLGANIGLVVPLAPKVLMNADFDSYLDHFRQVAESYGCYFYTNPMELIGYEFTGGRLFPEEYTDQERERVRQIMEKYGRGLRQDSDPEDLSRMHNTLYLKGMPCYRTKRSIHVSVDGLVSDCSYGAPRRAQKVPLADSEQFRVSDEMAPCPFDQCTCAGGGLWASLEPLGITLKEYFEEFDRQIAKHSA